MDILKEYFLLDKNIEPELRNHSKVQIESLEEKNGKEIKKKYYTALYEDKNPISISIRDDEKDIEKTLFTYEDSILTEINYISFEYNIILYTKVEFDSNSMTKEIIANGKTERIEKHFYDESGNTTKYAIRDNISKKILMHNFNYLDNKLDNIDVHDGKKSLYKEKFYYNDKKLTKKEYLSGFSELIYKREYFYDKSKPKKIIHINDEGTPVWKEFLTYEKGLLTKIEHHQEKPSPLIKRLIITRT